MQNSAVTKTTQFFSEEEITEVLRNKDYTLIAARRLGVSIEAVVEILELFLGELTDRKKAKK